jgi:hypothetical protein
MALQIVDMSIREAHNPQASALRHSNFVLRRDTKEIYSVDKYVWPIRQVIDDVAGSSVFPVLGLGLVYVCVGIGRSESRIAAGVRDMGVLSENVGLELTGFDVADATLISGLLNCEYRESEIEGLRATWSSKLNDYHLFDNEADAEAFRLLCDVRVPEHAPFLVYQLWCARGASR